MKLQHNIFQRKAITMDSQDYSTVNAKRKKGQHLGIAEHGAIKDLKQHASERVPLPERLDAFYSPLQTNCIEVHRPTKAAEEKLPVTLRNLDGRSTKPTERPATGNRKQIAAGTSPSG